VLIEMGLYSRYIFPRLMHWSMSNPQLAEERRAALSEVRGDVLEIGFGTGLNLPYYPGDVRRITAVDRNESTFRLASEQIAASSIAVDWLSESSEQLSMSDASIDSVVSTFTLCSINHVGLALAEIRRVLRPGGRFFFLEHGLSPDHRIARLQACITPLTRCIGEGCRLNRPIRRLIEDAGFEIVRCDEHYSPAMPKLAGYLYRGWAR
jgi:ubiquinone/menaquinone biosynthesis C-methylase UbiE